jgi:hypothetical protein
LDLPPLNRLNKTKQRAGVAEVSDQTRALIAARTKLDTLLYEYALAKISSQTESAAPLAGRSVAA